jgi:TatA/E family protein of Tat protein translocase
MSIFLFGVSMGEIVLIFLVVLMLFGSKTIPDLARSLGKGMNEFRKATEDIKREFEQSTTEIKEELSKIETNVRQNSNEIRDLANEAYRDDYGTNPAPDVYGLDVDAPEQTEPVDLVDTPVDDSEIKADDVLSTEQIPPKSAL